MRVQEQVSHPSRRRRVAKGDVVVCRGRCLRGGWGWQGEGGGGAVDDAVFFVSTSKRIGGKLASRVNGGIGQAFGGMVELLTEPSVVEADGAISHRQSLLQCTR